VLSELFLHTPKESINARSRIWIVFNILLEYCCRNEFESTITSVTEEYKQQLDDVNYSLKHQIDNLHQENQKLKSEIEEWKSKYITLETEWRMNHGTVELLKNELKSSRQKHEMEVAMRLA